MLLNIGLIFKIFLEEALVLQKFNNRFQSTVSVLRRTEVVFVFKKEYLHIFELSDLKLRPIVAGPICPTKPLSNLIDILLKLFLLHVKSYFKDNLDFLSKCSRENYEDILLVAFDVVNFYINIPHTFGMEALD